MVADSPWLSTLRGLAAEGVTPGFLSGTCRLALVGLRCLWVPRSCGVYDLRDGVTCLRSGLCSSLVRDCNEDFPSFWWVWFLAFVRGPLLRLALCSSACISPGGYPSFSQVSPAPSHWVPLLWTWLVWEASTVSFSYVFLWDVVTLLRQ